MKNIIAGFIPTIIWMVPLIIIYSRDMKKRYKELLLCFILGAIGSYFCYRLEMHFGSYFKKVAVSNYWEILFYAVFGVAIFEEGYKWFISGLTVRLYDKKREAHCFIIPLVTALGFSTFENIVYYAIPYGCIAGIKRITTAYISHLSCAVIMGFFMRQEDNKKIFIPYSLIIPTLIHALYNSFLYGGKYQYLFPYYYVLQLLLVIVVIKKMEKTQ